MQSNAELEVEMKKMTDLGVIPGVSDGERAMGFDDVVETFGNVGGLLKWDPRVYLPQIGGALPRIRREIPNRRLHHRISVAVPHPNQCFQSRTETPAAALSLK